MKQRFTLFSTLAAVFAVAVLASGLAGSKVAAAGPNVPGTDSTGILGPSPLFPTGYSTDQYAAWYKNVTDTTATTPAVAGSLEVFTGSTPAWIESATAGAAFPFGQYGIVYTAAPAQGGVATIQLRGLANALCTTGSVAIAKSNALIADGSGGLTVPAPSGTPSAGTATAKGTTGSTTYTYDVYARNAYNLDSAISADISTSSGNATLSPANSVQISVTVPAGTKEIIVVRKVGGAAQGVIGRSLVPAGNTVADFVDVGYTAGAASYTPNATPVFQPGQVLATALSTLAASTASETACTVFVGGF